MFGDKYKPPSRWSVSDEEWECYMVNLITQPSFDPHIFNTWWYEKVKFDALEQLEQPTIRTPSRRRGKLVRKKGLSTAHKKPDLEKSIEEYGTLHFETEYGYHKTEAPKPRGRSYGTAGSFIIVPVLGSNLHWSRTYRCGNTSHANWGAKDIVGAVNAMIEEAEKRRDRITLLFAPPMWEKDWKSYWLEEPRKEGERKRITVQVWNREGKELAKSDYDPTKKVWNYAVLDYTWNRNSQGPTYNDQVIESSVKQMNFTGWHGEVSAPSFINSTDYDGLREFMLSLPPFGSPGYMHALEFVSDYNVIIQYIKGFWSELSITARSTLIFVMNGSMPGLVAMNYKVFETLNEYADIFIFDIGKNNMESFYFGVPNKDGIDECDHLGWTRYRNGRNTHIPLLMSGGERLFTYVHVPDIQKLTEEVILALGDGFKRKEIA